MTRLCWLLATLLLLVVASASGPAAAQGAARSRVALVAPTRPSPLAREVLVRARGELTAAGFEVVTATAAEGSAPESALAAASHGTGAAASLGVADTGRSMWVWTPGPGTSGPTLEGVACCDEPATSQAGALAIRAVELLRARLDGANELQSTTPRPAPALHPVTERAPAASVRDDAPRVELTVGFAARLAFDGLDPSFGPQLSAGLVGVSGWLARVRFVGPLRGDTAAPSGGRADVREELGLLEAGLGARLDPLPVRLSAALGLGASHTTVTGEPTAPFLPRTDSAWAAVGAITLEASAHPSDFAFVAVDSTLCLATPQLTVALAGEPLGTLGRPSVTFGARAGLSF